MRLANVLVLLAVLGLCSGAAFADPAYDTGETWEHIWQGARATYAEVEPNNDCATAQEVVLGDIVDPASIGAAGDFDFYKVYLTTADRMCVILDRATGCTTTIDTQMYLYSDDCTTQLAYDDDDGPGLYSYINGTEWTPSYDGYYYVKVKHYSATGTGCYKAWFYAGTAATGACCVPSTGVCTVVGPGSCSSPSVWQGPGTTCDPNPCPQPILGACCATTGFCTVTIQTACTSPSVWQGPDTVCNPNPCPGAQPPPVNDTCDGAIALTRCSSGTESGDLTWAINDYTTAGSSGCTGYQALAKDVVYVANLLAGDILHLVYTTPSHDGSLYVITDCANSAGSCVIGEDDPEPETITWTATADGTYYIICDGYSANAGGAFTLEWSITCPPPSGNCCYPDGSCAVTIQADCTGIWTEGGGCEPNPCEQPLTGSCCYPDGTCAVTVASACTGIWTEGGVCEPNPCEQPPADGSCCYPDGSCAVTIQADCTAIWTAGGVCEPNTCEQPPVLGACCDHSTGGCEITTQADCPYDWLGEGVPCNLETCVPPTPVERTSWGRIKNTYR